MSEPNNNADEQLKRYAAERLAQGAPDLHPATRRMLQGEVARVYGTQRGAVRTGWRRWLLGPGFAWALGLAVVAGMTLLVVRESGPSRTKEDAAPPAVVLEKLESKTQKAKEELAKNEEPPQAKAPAPAPVAAPATTAPEVASEAREKKPTTKATSPGAVVEEKEGRRDVALKESPARALRDENAAIRFFANRAYPQMMPTTAPSGAASSAKDARKRTAAFSERYRSTIRLVS